MTGEKIKGLQVELKDAEKIRKYLQKEKLLRQDLLIQKDKRYIYFPIKKQTGNLKRYEIVNLEFKIREKRLVSYKEILAIPDNLKHILPSSYDVVGDIALVKLSDELLEYREKTGEAILKANKNIKTVCLIQPVKGELRTRELEIIAGLRNTKTLHKEYGLKYYVDIDKTYFSPRLANERKRIANLVKPGETIIDMFTGVAPFSIMIARYANPKIIYCFDKNKDAIRLAYQNIKLNKVLDKIEVFCEDAVNIYKVLKKTNVKADRIIMNLPFSAYQFFNNALKIINKNCYIHYYTISEESEIPIIIEKLKTTAKKKDIILTDFNIRKIKSYSPSEFYIGIDITAKKKK